MKSNFEFLKDSFLSWQISESFLKNTYTPIPTPA